MPIDVISTVTTAATTYDLVALDDLKSDLAITSDSLDAYFARQISMASAAAANYCNRVFPAETLSDQIFLDRRTRGGRSAQMRLATTLQLSRFPIIAVTSVTETTAGTATTLVAGTDFTIDPDKGQLVRLDDNGNPAVWRSDQVTVVFQAGFETIPLDVQDAVTRMIKQRYLERGKDPALRAQNIPGVIEQQWWVSNGATGNLPPDVADLLDNYRVPPVIG